MDLEKLSHATKVCLLAAALAIFWCLVFGLIVTPAHADQINVSALANAIYRAENSKAHPYGVMRKYKHTTPRQACINTIRSAQRRWNGQGDFIVFLGRTYSPPDINPNWVRLVKFFYKKELDKQN